jgi:hypothetical protein
MPKEMALPDLKRPGTFLEPNTSNTAPRTPGLEQTGPVPLSAAPLGVLPVEQLMEAKDKTATSQGLPTAPVPNQLPIPTPVAQPAKPAAPAK